MLFFLFLKITKISLLIPKKGKDGECNLPDADLKKASICNITADGNEYMGAVTVADKKISLSLKAGQAVAIKGIF
jgi:hypothetical protein